MSYASAAVLLSTTHLLRLGPLRLSLYGLCAALGLVLAMALSRRTASRLGLDPEQAWNAGVFAIFSCFVFSRLVLIVRDPTAFRRFPLAVLGLPSLTFGGLALAGVATAIYLARKRLPLLRILDTFAAPGALLAVALELGHWLEGSELGMPIDRTGTLRHPVSLYGVLASVLLTAVLWWLTQRPRRPGMRAALAFLAGGATAFGLDMLTEPAPISGDAWLEPGQWVALTAIAAGAALWALPLSRRENLSTVAATTPDDPEPSGTPEPHSQHSAYVQEAR